MEKRGSMGVEPEYKVKGEVGLEARLWKLCDDRQAFQCYCHLEAYLVAWDERNRTSVNSGSKTSLQDTALTIDITGLY